MRVAFRERNASAMVVTNHKNILYLCGFIGISEVERESSMLITEHQAILFVPHMYEAQARVSSGIADGSVRMIVDAERDGLLTIFANHVKEGENVLFEASDVRVSELERMKNATRAMLIPSEGVIETLRLIKDDDEIMFLKQAAQISELTFNAILEYLSTHEDHDLTELELAEIMLKISRKFGGEGWGFDPIIASGAASAIPHYVTSGKVIENHAPLLLDFGVRYKGYTADMTRTVHLGPASEKFKEMYHLVLYSNRRSMNACKPGAVVEDLYHISNEKFLEQGLSQNYLHGLGHGIGLAVHEAPYSRPGQKTLLQKGMVTSIEPGLYFEGEFGVRIEDMALITEHGSEVLTSRSSKELIEIV